MSRGSGVRIFRRYRGSLRTQQADHGLPAWLRSFAAPRLKGKDALSMLLPQLKRGVGHVIAVVQSFHSKSALCGALFAVTLRSRTRVREIDTTDQLTSSSNRTALAAWLVILACVSFVVVRNVRNSASDEDSLARSIRMKLFA